MDFEKEVASIDELQRQSSGAEEKAKKRLEELRQKIINGETTGDIIKDFSIVVNNTLSEEAEQPYRQLEEMLKGKEGEQVLIVNEDIESFSKIGCLGGYSGTNVNSTLRLGALTSSNLELVIGEMKDFEISSIFSSWKDDNKEPRLILHVENHALQDYSSKEWELKKGNIIIPFYDFANFSPDEEKTISTGIAIRSDEMPSYSKKLLIKIGSQNVEDYFRASETLFDGKDDFSYVEALKLLGIGEQASAHFIAGYNNEIGELKGDIVNKLKKLTAEEKRLIIATDYDQFKGDKDLMDEVAFKLNAPLDKLRETRKNIKSRLESAINLDMHIEPLIIDGERPGETLDVQRYIATMCKKYRIKI